MGHGERTGVVSLKSLRSCEVVIRGRVRGEISYHRLLLLLPILTNQPVDDLREEDPY
jgi:hypothetical protein